MENAELLSQFQVEYAEMQKSLKDVDETIKKITGRDPAEARQQNVRRNAGGDFRNRDRPNNQGFFRPTPESGANLEAVVQKGQRGNNFNRFQGNNNNNNERGERVNSRFKNKRYFPQQNDESPDEDEPQRKLTLQSSVVAFPKEVRTRKDSIETQKGDKRVMDRNRRMFGMILGTLQKFQTEESKRKDQAQKRAEIEQKLELAATKEKEEMRKERQGLFLTRRDKQAQIRRLEQKMDIAKLHDEWEKRQRHLMNFNMTKAMPPIFYKPKKSNSESEKRLKVTRQKIEDEIRDQNLKIVAQLLEIDELYRKGGLDGEEDDEEEIEDEMDHSTVVSDPSEAVATLGDKENLGPVAIVVAPVILEGPELPSNMDANGKMVGETGEDVKEPVLAVANELVAVQETEIEVDSVKAKGAEENLTEVTQSSGVPEVEMESSMVETTVEGVETEVEIVVEKPLEAPIGDQEFEPIYD